MVISSGYNDNNNNLGYWKETDPIPINLISNLHG